MAADGEGAVRAADEAHGVVMPAELLGALTPIAPWPNVDRYPTVIGSNITTAYISAVYKACTFGYRREYVDILNELLERDPHAYAAVSRRVLAVAGARMSFSPPPSALGTPEEDIAKEIADDVARRVDAIPYLHAALADLQWAVFYGPTASEILWEPRDGWTPVELSFLHSRRISYPDQNTWEAHVWDQGAVGFATGIGAYPSERLYGFPISRYPNKFILHVPRVRGDYPTRDGIGREVAYWLAMKGMAIRGAGQFIERFAKPWVLGKYKTGRASANDKDIDVIKAVAAAIANGTLSSGTIPDTTEADIQSPALNASSGNLQHVDFIEFVDRQVSKAALGQSDTLDPGKNGSRSATETRNESTTELFRYDAGVLAEDLRTWLVRPIVRLNRPGFEHLAPVVTLHVAERPNPKERIDVVARAVDIGMPADADAVGAELGIPLVKNPGSEPRMLGRAQKAAPSAPEAAPPPSTSTEPKPAPDDETLSAEEENA